MGNKTRSNYGADEFCAMRKHCIRDQDVCRRHCVGFSEYKRKVRHKGDERNVVEIGKGRERTVIRRKEMSKYDRHKITREIRR